MSQDPGNRRDWRVSAILLVIWTVSVTFLKVSRDEIPVSMLAIASLFFVFLIPAMNDLVRSIERYAFGRDTEDGQDSSTR